MNQKFVCHENIQIQNQYQYQDWFSVALSCYFMSSTNTIWNFEEKCELFQVDQKCLVLDSLNSAELRRSSTNAATKQ